MKQTADMTMWQGVGGSHRRFMFLLSGMKCNRRVIGVQTKIRVWLGESGVIQLGVLRMAKNRQRVAGRREKACTR